MRKPLIAILVVLAGCAAPVTTGRVTAPPAVPAPASTATAPASMAESPSTELPARLSDAEFWKLQADLSEPGGYFRIEDNYTSNEMEVGQLVDWPWSLVTAARSSFGPVQ